MLRHAQTQGAKVEAFTRVNPTIAQRAKSLEHLGISRGRVYREAISIGLSAALRRLIATVGDAGRE